MPRFKRTAIAVAALFLAAVATILGIAQLYWMLVALLALPFISCLLARQSLSGLEVRRWGPSTVTAGDEVEFRLQVRNVGRVRRFFFWVRDRLPRALAAATETSSPPPVEPFEPVLRPAPGAQLVAGVGPGEQALISYRLRARRRGVHPVGPTELVASDALGIRAYPRLVGSADELVVYPRTVPLPRFVLGLGAYDATAARRRGLPGDGPEFRNLREYVPGDDLRRVHWKTSARRNKLTVVELEQAHALRLAVVLDLSREALVGEDEETTVEYAISAAASLAEHALRCGGQVRLFAEGSSPVPAEELREPELLPRLLEALARVEPEGDTPIWTVVERAAAELEPRTTVAIISPSTDPQLAAAVARLKAHGLRPLNLVIRADTFLRPDDLLALESGLGPRYAAFIRDLVGAGSTVYSVGSGDDLAARLGVPRALAR